MCTKAIRIMVVLSLMGLFSGCATMARLTPEQLASADYGDYPHDYQQLVKDYFETILFDPYSAKYKFTEPIKGYTRKAPILGGDVDRFGYVVTVWVNAKNRFGGYVGAKQHRFLIRNGQVLEIVYPNPYFSEAWYQ